MELYLDIAVTCSSCGKVFPKGAVVDIRAAKRAKGMFDRRWFEATYGNIRKELVSEGWNCTANCDYCPDCAEGLESGETEQVFSGGTSGVELMGDLVSAVKLKIGKRQ